MTEIKRTNTVRALKKRLRELITSEGFALRSSSPKGVPETRRDRSWDLVLETTSQLINSYEQQVEKLGEQLKNLEAELKVRDRDRSEMRESLDELLTLQKLSEAIRSTLDPDEVLEALSHLSEKILTVEDCGIFLIEDGTGGLRPMPSPKRSEKLEKAARRLSEDGIIDWVVGERKPIVVPDIDTLSNTPGESPERNFIVAPLIVGNKGTGVFLVSTPQPKHTFTPHTMQLLLLLTNQAAVAIQNAQSYEELRDTHDALRESQAQLIHSSKLAAIGELAAAVAHEVNNPLQAVSGHVSLLLMRKDIGEETRAKLKIVKGEARRIGSIVQSLLSFARKGKSEEKALENVDINETLSELEVLTRHALLIDRIRLTLDLDKELPKVPGHSGKLHQVFMNMISNAHQAMPQGGELSIRTTYRDGFVHVAFSDTGVGIPQENLEKIFHSFFTTKSSGKGTGLGLSISSKIVEEHEGIIQVESEVGKGTTFTVQLPVRRRGKSL